MPCARFLPAGRLQHGGAAGVDARQPGLFPAQEEGARGPAPGRPQGGAGARGIRGARAGAAGAAQGGREPRPGPHARLAASLLHRGRQLQRRQPQLPQLPQLRHRRRGHARVGTQVRETEGAVLAQRRGRPVAPQGCCVLFWRQR